MSLFDLLRYPINRGRVTVKQYRALPIAIREKASALIDKSPECVEYKFLISTNDKRLTPKEKIEAARVKLDKKISDVLIQTILEHE